MSLAQNAQWKKIEEQAKEDFQFYLGNYDIAAAAQFDKDSFSGKDLNDMGTFVKFIAEGIQNVVLKGADEKSAVQSKIKSVKYVYGAPKYNLDQNSFVVHTDLGSSGPASDIRDGVTEWIMNNL